MKAEDVLELLTGSLVECLKQEAPVRDSQKLIFPASSVGHCPISALLDAAGIQPERPFQEVTYAYMGSALHRFLEHSLGYAPATLLAQLGLSPSDVNLELRVVRDEEYLAATIDVLLGDKAMLEIKTVRRFFSDVPEFWKHQLGAQRIVCDVPLHYLVQMRRDDGAIDVVELDSAAWTDEVRTRVQLLIKAIEAREIPYDEDLINCKYCHHYPCTDIDWNAVFDILQEKLRVMREEVLANK